ncbi:MAG: MarR family transcriptional regulator [Robiginitomaculum sp.]|nr:MarR family transcriptional regulator [Robiginitomaculum sp.]
METTSMFELKNFLPYKLSILSQSVSGLIATEYESKFGLSMNQWRCLVIINARQPITAQAISDLTLLDKMTISRTVRTLKSRKLIQTETPGTDARRRLLSLTKSGNQIYNEVIPIAKNYESRLLASLTPKEQHTLEVVMAKLLHGTRELSADNRN